MGLYIPEMPMPENCYDCQIENYVPNCPVYMYYSATEYMTKRHPDCPIIEVPTPHGDLIDFDEIPWYEDLDDLMTYFGVVKDMPTWIGREE